MANQSKRESRKTASGKLAGLFLLPEETLMKRFWDKVSPEPNSGCWLWDGTWSDSGYGLFLADGSYGRAHRAHRFSYEHHVGPIPEGLDLDHLCRVRCCVNPDHLEPVTRKENIRRGLTGKKTGERNRKKTHCPRGHPYEGDNLYTAPSGARHCVKCMRASSRHSKRRARLRSKQGVPLRPFPVSAFSPFHLVFCSVPQ